MNMNEFIDLKEYYDYIIREDNGDGDHTSLACIPADEMGKAVLLCKEEGVLAGVDVARDVFKAVDTRLEMEVFLEDGSNVKPGDRAFILSGPVQSILRAERLALNLMQRMSGIATTAHKISEMIADLHTRVLDTRKTTPGLRWFEKEAVRIGGGTNHRFGLYDMIMIKDNHIDYAGGIPQAIQRVKDYLAEKGKDLKIEVEARDIDEVKLILETGGVDRIMFDNFSPDEIREALKLVDGKAETEASGGITIDTVRSYAETGVDFVSMGALTHSVKSLDLSLKALD